MTCDNSLDFTIESFRYGPILHLECDHYVHHSLTIIRYCIELPHSTLLNKSEEIGGLTNLRGAGVMVVLCFPGSGDPECVQSSGERFYSTTNRQRSDAQADWLP